MRGKRRRFLREAVSTAELYVLYTQKQRRITDAVLFAVPGTKTRNQQKRMKKFRLAPNPQR